jgi:hypothetical protein
MPCEAGKTCRDPVFFIPLRLISQSTLFVTGVDKPQVSALNLNRGKFVKKPSDSIRRKFSIDAATAIVSIRRIHHFETIPIPFWKLGIHHSRRMQRSSNAKPAPACGLSQAARGALAFA